MNELDKQKEYNLSGDDILKICNGKANLYSYPQLSQFSDIEQVLGQHKACIILYETAKNFGHWVCVFQYPNQPNIIEFFDPYGLLPDDELKFIPEHFRNQSNQDFTLLTYLLLKSNKKIEYNQHKFQKFLEDINTCGRWVGSRLLLRNLTLPQFYNHFKPEKGVDSDDLITLFTQNLNN